MRHELDEPACDTTMIPTSSYFDFEVIKVVFVSTSDDGDCFDPESVYHVVELVRRNQSGLQSWTPSPKTSLVSFLIVFTFIALLN